MQSQIRQRKITKAKLENLIKNGNKESKSKELNNHFFKKFKYLICILITFAILFYNKTSKFNFYNRIVSDSQTSIPEATIKNSNHGNFNIPEKFKKLNEFIKFDSSKLSKSEITEKINFVQTSLNNQSNSTSLDSCFLNYYLAQLKSLLADKEKSNNILTQAIKQYKNVDINCPQSLVIKTAETLSEKCTFIGNVQAAIPYYIKVTNIIDNKKLLKDLGIFYLMVGEFEKSYKPFNAALEIDPNYSIALVNLGWAKSKQAESNGDDKVTFLEVQSLILKGLSIADKNDSDYDEINHTRYYNVLANSYLKTGNRIEFNNVNKLAADRGVYLSAMQRSAYNIDHLKAQPLWTPKQANVKQASDILEQNYKIIKSEAISIFQKHISKMEKESESLSINNGKSDWRQFTLWSQGRKNFQNCKLAPKTCQIVERLINWRFNNCKRGQIKFSVMTPGTKIWPHTGPTNTRLRLHLPLLVPEDYEKLFIIMAQKFKKHWVEGQSFIIDDSFEHEVEHNGSSVRIILIVDFWHPELTRDDVRDLSPI